VRLLEKESFGAALLYFTGSKNTTSRLRGRANKMGYTLNEYALATLKGERPVARETTDILRQTGLEYIPPDCAKTRAKSTRRGTPLARPDRRCEKHPRDIADGTHG